MNDSAAVRAGSHSAGTSHVGPLGSTVHVLRADAGTIAWKASAERSSSKFSMMSSATNGRVSLRSANS